MYTEPQRIYELVRHFVLNIMLICKGTIDILRSVTLLQSTNPLVEHLFQVVKDKVCCNFEVLFRKFQVNHFILLFTKININVVCLYQQKVTYIIIISKIISALVLS